MQNKITLDTINSFVASTGHTDILTSEFYRKMWGALSTQKELTYFWETDVRFSLHIVQPNDYGRVEKLLPKKCVWMAISTHDFQGEEVIYWHNKKDHDTYFEVVNNVRKLEASS